MYGALHQLSGDKGRQQNVLLGLLDKCEKRAMVSSLSMTRMTRMTEMLEAIGRPSF